MPALLIEFEVNYDAEISYFRQSKFLITIQVCERLIRILEKYIFQQPTK